MSGVFDNSFAGTDIVAGIDVPVIKGNTITFAHYIFGELQTISYSIHRPAAPVRALGFSGPKGFTRGSRLIAGSLVFTVFDRHIVYRILEQYQKAFPSRVFTDEMPPFHVTVVFNNEYGVRSALRIYGICVVDEGQVMSVNDMYTEQTMTYVARDMVPMHPDLLFKAGAC
ncbi:MAG: virion structural protein [Bacillota bacterium]